MDVSQQLHLKTNRYQEVAESREPSSRSLFQTINGLTKTTNMWVWMGEQNLEVDAYKPLHEGNHEEKRC